MNISNITPPQVWTSSSRSLTNFGSSALAATSVQNATLAASAVIDLRTSPGIVGVITIAGQTGATATSTLGIKMDDGTNTFILATSAAGANQPVQFNLVNTNTVGGYIQNSDGAVAAKYNFAAWVMTI